MVGLLAIWMLSALLGMSQAVPEPKYRLLEEVDPDLEAIVHSDLPHIEKRDLEFNQYVPAYLLRGEPSCEELRTMWRLSKREARRATSTNNLPRSRPYNFGRFIGFVSSPHGRPYIYGRSRNFASHMGSRKSPLSGKFSRLRTMLGGAGRPGSFTKLRTMVTDQRRPGDSSKGSYKILEGMVKEHHFPKESPEEVVAGSPPLRSSEMYQPVRRAPPISRYRYEQRQLQVPKEGFVGPLLSANPASSSFTSVWNPRAWNPRTKSCLQVEGDSCEFNSECACAGQYRCSKRRCKVFSVIPEIEDDQGTWFSGALPKQELGSSSMGSTDDWNQNEKTFQN